MKIIGIKSEVKMANQKINKHKAMMSAQMGERIPNHILKYIYEQGDTEQENNKSRTDSR